MLPNKLIQASRLTWRIGVLLIAIAPIAQAATCLRPPAGLANWWSLDGSAKDFLTGNAGAVSGATFTSGKVGQAIQFSSYLDGVNAGSLAIPSDFTIGAWIYPTGSSIGGNTHPGPGPIAEFFGNVSFFQHPSINDVHVALRDQTSGAITTVTGFGGIVPNSWNYAAVTYSKSSGVAKLYANGVMTASTVVGSIDLPAARDFYIGLRAPGAFSPAGTTYNGRLDEVQLFSRVLSAAEVMAIQNAGAAGVCRANWWPLDGNANDVLGVRPGSVLGGAFVAGNVGQAIQLSSFLDGVKVPSVRISDEFTIDAWIYPTGSSIGGFTHPGPGPIAEFYSNVSLFQHPSINDVQVALRDQATGAVRTVTGFGGIVPNTWNHTAVTYSKVSGTAIVYTNGVMTASGVVGSIDLPAQQDFYIGLRAPGSFNQAGTTYNGRLDEVRVFDRVMSSAEILALFQGAPVNTPPTANAGLGQAIHAGDTVYLNGGSSFDDNTPTASLAFSWVFTGVPAGSLATLLNANTATPRFVSDKAGTYTVRLVVTDRGALQSAPAYVTISSTNQAPTANAGPDQLVVIGQTVTLNGSLSRDPENDTIFYSWSILSAPAGSTAALNGATTVSPYLQPAVPGSYVITLTASDPFGGVGTPASVQVTAMTATTYVEQSIMTANQQITSLPPAQVTTAGNQSALSNFLTEVVKATQKGDTATAIAKLNQAISRTDGCERNGVPDSNGPGRDWITDCSAQASMLVYLRASLQALSP